MPLVSQDIFAVSLLGGVSNSLFSLQPGGKHELILAITQRLTSLLWTLHELIVAYSTSNTQIQFFHLATVFCVFFFYLMVGGKLIFVSRLPLDSCLVSAGAFSSLELNRGEEGSGNGSANASIPPPDCP